MSRRVLQVTAEHMLCEPGRSDAQANRRRVLDAAREVFKEQGQAAEMREIARRADVGLATIYRGFGNKEGLLLALAQQFMSDVFGLLSVAEEQRSPVDGLRHVLTGAIEFIDKYGPVFDISAGHFRSSSPQSHAVDFRSRMHKLVERGVHSGDFRDDIDIDVVVHVIFGSLVTMAHARDLTPVPRSEDYANTVLRLLARPARQQSNDARSPNESGMKKWRQQAAIRQVRNPRSS
ncbi:MAG: TetR/AcrR family transcriptional regulator [Chloroflexi bacterium]|nr:TetR/AcrR family transcriptional regulator [Chloroflexota bacterium]